MSPDEQAIRTLIETWMQATAENDLPRVLELMDDDVVFLGPGRPPTGKDFFAAAARAMEGKVRIHGTAHIQEIRVFGEWAYCWNQLTVTMQPTGGGASTRRGGPVLSILRKKPNGRWVIVRDANMLTTFEQPSPDRGPAMARAQRGSVSLTRASRFRTSATFGWSTGSAFFQSSTNFE